MTHYLGSTSAFSFWISIDKADERYESRDAKSKSFSPLNFSYFESALVFIAPYSSHIPFTYTPYSLLVFSYPVYSNPITALILPNPAYSHPISALTLSHLVYPPPISALTLSHLVYSHPVSTLILSYPVYANPITALILPNPAYSHPISALELFASRLLASRICS